jgi:hypothetical protein
MKNNVVIRQSFNSFLIRKNVIAFTTSKILTKGEGYKHKVLIKKDYEENGGYILKGMHCL